MNFLITSGQCVVYIKGKMTLESKHGTAVLEHVNLVLGKVYDILDLTFHPNFKPDQTEDTTDFDVGVIKVYRFVINFNFILKLISLLGH